MDTETTKSRKNFIPCHRDPQGIAATVRLFFFIFFPDGASKYASAVRG
jgi:hypothetical protein